MTHSYEEIRLVALDILSGRETVSYGASQYVNLAIGVAEVFGRREKSGSQRYTHDPKLDPVDANLFQEVFWDLFRQGIITLGLNSSNLDFPWFRVTELGKKIIENRDGYFFHDTSSYEKVLTDEVSKLDAVTLDYAKEAMQAFRSGCLLSASVMLGVATEHTFDLLLEDVSNSAAWSPTFKKALSEKLFLRRLNAFKATLDSIKNKLSAEVKEDLDTQFAGITSIVRTFRNESGHPTGKIISREQTFVLLQLFVPYCKKMYQLRDFFTTP